VCGVLVVFRLPKDLGNLENLNDLSNSAERLRHKKA
jgi:hypothetical protein